MTDFYLPMGLGRKCCGVGNCNVFCCNCEGGCLKPAQENCDDDQVLSNRMKRGIHPGRHYPYQAEYLFFEQVFRYLDLSLHTNLFAQYRQAVLQNGNGFIDWRTLYGLRVTSPSRAGYLEAVRNTLTALQGLWQQRGPDMYVWQEFSNLASTVLRLRSEQLAHGSAYCHAEHAEVLSVWTIFSNWLSSIAYPNDLRRWFFFSRKFALTKFVEATSNNLTF